MSDDIPFDAMECIFAHLPVKILIKYRCVSKSVRDLIDSRYFTNLHLHHSIRTGSNRNILCRIEGIHSVNLDTLRHSELLDCPRAWNYCVQFIGTCNGVVLLYNGLNEITLWNPAIRRYIDVTVPLVDVPEDSYWSYKTNFGFGYDNVNHDYKVVMSMQLDFTARLDGVHVVNEVHVYSLNSNSWTRVGDFPYSVRNNGYHATYVNGAFYWVCVGGTSDSGFHNFIVAFDLATEEYRVVPQPVYDDIDSQVGIMIGSVGGSLWVYCYLDHPDDLGNEDDLVGIADTWLLLQRDGEEDSWTKLVSVDRPVDFRRPLAYSRCGKRLLLENYGKFLWYDLVREVEGEDINISGLPVYCNSDVCFESLVHLDGGASDEENQLREKNVTEDDISKNNQDSIFSTMGNFVIQVIWEILEL